MPGPTRGNRGSLLGESSIVKLLEPLASKVPPERHVAFLTDLWTHLASYGSGFLGGILLIVWAWRKRHQVSTIAVHASGQLGPTSAQPMPGDRLIRLDDSDPTGRKVNALRVSSLKMWVRCIWPDLMEKKRGPAPSYPKLLEPFRITPPHQVYEVQGKIIATKKPCGNAQEVSMFVEKVFDVTAEAQQALNSAEVYYALTKKWPDDDNF